MTHTKSSTEQPKDWNQLITGPLDQSVHQVGFFQAIRRIEEHAREFPRVGHAQQVDQDPLRIRQTVELDFAAATVDRIDSAHDGRANLSQRFFGLLGPGGPLPLSMTEQVRHESRHNGDATMESFLNIFHHRMATLFYRAWSSSRGAVQRDRPDEDRFSAFLSALSGVLGEPTPGADDAGDRQLESDETRIHFTGRFASAHRNAEGLGAVVATTLRAGVRVRSFLLRHLRLENEDRTLLSVTPTAEGRGGRLGQSVVLGRSVPDRRSMVGLDIGPIDLRRFQSLLPGGELHNSLRRLVRGYVDPSIECRVRLILDQRKVPRMTLGQIGTLGRNAWLHSRPPGQDAGDCQFLL
tara:strand:+ start:29275 stop:30330 length:1056 start_codon:yes stop_codon:yes gene_type:complete